MSPNLQKIQINPDKYRRHDLSVLMVAIALILEFMVASF